MYPYTLTIYFACADHRIVTRHESYGEAMAEWLELVILWEWKGEAGKYTDCNGGQIDIYIEYQTQAQNW